MPESGRTVEGVSSSSSGSEIAACGSSKRGEAKGEVPVSFSNAFLRPSSFSFSASLGSNFSLLAMMGADLRGLLVSAMGDVGDPG